MKEIKIKKKQNASTLHSTVSYHLQIFLTIPDSRSLVETCLKSEENFDDSKRSYRNSNPRWEYSERKPVTSCCPNLIACEIL